jgi:hypothetical protein
MLIDYISQDRLPWIVVWLDWNFYAYGASWYICLAIACAHWWWAMPFHSSAALGLALFVGSCLWVVYCAVRYGYAVG